MDGLMQWIVELNRDHHVGFAVLTVVTMAGAGILISLAVDLAFRLLGIKIRKIEIHH